LQVPYPAEEFADSGSLREGFGPGGLERFLGIQRALSPGCLALVVRLDDDPSPAITCLGYAAAVAAQAFGSA
jgi:hypothetical protein